MNSQGDTRFLELHGRQWRVVVYVPRHLRRILGKAAFRKGLKTDSLKIAQARRWAALADIRKTITGCADKAEAGPTSDPLIAEAMAHRQDRSRLTQSDPEALDLLDTIVWTRKDEIEAEQGAAKARGFFGIAHGISTPISLHHDAFLREHKHLAKRTLGDHRRALKILAAFAPTIGIVATVEALSERRNAGLFASHLASAGTHPATANKVISMLAGYWRWMIRRGLAPGSDPKRDNPWHGQSIAGRQPHRAADPTAPRSEGKRAFTDEEVASLLYGPTPETTFEPLLVDLMKVAALTGMRISEIIDLRVRDIDTEAWSARISSAKTKAGRRTVPIHSDLSTIVVRLSEGKSPEAPLFPRLQTQLHRSSQSEVYMPLSKRFARHRMRLGIHEKPEGQRQSNIDFHSFRRWFITKAEQAGVPPHIISTVVGHAEGRKGMTLGVYSAGPSLAQLRACVEAVRLPPGSGGFLGAR